MNVLPLRYLPNRYVAGTGVNRCATLIFVAIGATASLFAGAPVNLTFLSAGQTTPTQQCSAAVRVGTIDSFGQASNVAVNTRIYFTGSSSSLAFYTDSGCSNPAPNGVMIQAGTSSKRFFTMGSIIGSALIQVSTSNLGAASQSENIVASIPLPAPPPIPSGGVAGRPIPAPIYGVTLDDVAHLNAEITSLQQLAHMPTARVVFDYSEPPSYYAGPIQQLRGVSYIMGQIADSSDMSKFTVASYQNRTQNYVATLGSQVDVWEIGNEVNGDWLGSNTLGKIETAYDVVSAAGGATAITLFYEGEPTDRYNCISTDNGGNDMFTWINQNFQTQLSPTSRNPETEKIRLGVNYVLVSWYPDQCNNLQPNWSDIYARLAAIFPNSKLGFGEIGTANPQGGSQYEVNLINQFYPLAKNTLLPAGYIGGYFWWYYAEEMVPTTATTLFGVLNTAIR